MTTTILQTVANLPRLDAVKALAAALVEITADMEAFDLPGVMPVINRAVPVKKRKSNRFAAVWAYLETVAEYSSIDGLRADLVARFGKTGTPSRSNLHRHLMQNRKKGGE